MELLTITPHLGATLLYFWPSYLILAHPKSTKLISSPKPTINAFPLCMTEKNTHSLNGTRPPQAKPYPLALFRQEEIADAYVVSTPCRAVMQGSFSRKYYNRCLFHRLFLIKSLRAKHTSRLFYVLRLLIPYFIYIHAKMKPAGGMSWFRAD